MARRVYLHVGLPKTGTTFLQTTMWHNRAQLAAQGFLYPGGKRMDHFHASNAVRGRRLTFRADNEAAWDRLVDELFEWDGAGLISNEFFSVATTLQARATVAALRPAEVHVVVTARDYVRQFPAVWQEALKMNSQLSLDEFMKQAFARELKGSWSWRSQDLPEVLGRWATAVPPERVHVITVPPPGAPRHLLWQRWCEVLELDDSTFDTDLTFDNESLGAAQAALMHRLAPYLQGSFQDGANRHRWVRQYFGHEVLVPQEGERFGLRPDDVAALTTLSEEAVEEIERASYPVTGDLADLIPTQAQPDRPHPDDISEYEMLDVAARAIDRMIRDVRDLTVERNHWRSTARKSMRAAARRAAADARKAEQRKRGHDD